VIADVGADSNLRWTFFDLDLIDNDGRWDGEIHLPEGVVILVTTGVSPGWVAKEKFKLYLSLIGPLLSSLG
jgi:hypothetical protein